MTDLRNWTLALPVTAVMLSAICAPAKAQTVLNPAFVCNANAGVPPVVRAEGLTELLGDFILNCTGGNPAKAGAPVPLSNVQIFLNANITSRILNSGNLSEATLLIDEPLPPPAARVPGKTVFVPLGIPPPQVLCTPQGNACPIMGDGLGTPYETIPGVPTVYSGRQVAVNSVAWLGVPIDAPGTANTRVIRITNVRGNACQLGASSTLIPVQIVMFIAVNGSQQVTINNPQQTVAFIQPGLVVGGTADMGLQCVSQNTTLITSTNSSPDHNGPNFSITFREGFASSFTRRNISLAGAPQGDMAPVVRAQNIPGYPYNTESGFYNPALFTATPGVGLADFGTRIRITFNNVGMGTTFFVPTLVNLTSGGVTTTPHAPPAPANTPAGVAVGRLVLVQTDQFGNSDPGFTGIDPTGISAGIPVAPLTASNTAGQAFAVYEVVNSDVNAIETATIPVSVAFVANTGQNLPGLGQATANVSFAPAGGLLAGIQTADMSAPIPRFCDNSTPRNVFAINQCSCNLLFPFVTNQSGFNTGIAIANTSLDPFGTAAQAGRVTLFFFGGVAPGNPAPPPITTTGVGPQAGVVPAGCELVFTLLNGGGVMPVNCGALVDANSTTTLSLQTPALAGFQGYIIATAQFQWCHGFAFISDLSGNNLAEGYLAIQLDLPVLNRTGSVGENEVH